MYLKFCIEINSVRYQINKRILHTINLYYRALTDMTSAGSSNIYKIGLSIRFVSLCSIPNPFRVIVPNDVPLQVCRTSVLKIVRKSGTKTTYVRIYVRGAET